MHVNGIQIYIIHTLLLLLCLSNGFSLRALANHYYLLIIIKYIYTLIIWIDLKFKGFIFLILYKINKTNKQYHKSTYNDLFYYIIFRFSSIFLDIFILMKRKSFKFIIIINKNVSLKKI